MSPWQSFGIELDHLVVAAPSLESGAAWLEQRLGVALQGGGRHPGWGTHNRLLQLGLGTYLELIAPDPDQPPPARPRPFGLDRDDVRARLRERPRLVHFVMRTTELAAAVPALGYDPGPITPMSRGPLQWRITVPPDGRPAGDGVLPTLIQWDIDFVTQHPTATLEPRGVTLARLTIGAPAPSRALLDGIEGDRRIVLVAAQTASLAAELNTPKGAVTLD